MSRALHPTGWKPTCWIVFLVSVAAMTLVIAYYAAGAA